MARSLGAATAYKGTVHALASIARSEGWVALYAGLAPALLGAGLSWGAYFAAYSAAKERWVGRLDGGDGGGGSTFPFPFSSSSSRASSSSGSSSSSSSFSLPAAAHMAAAAEAGALVALLTNPVWVVKTRLQLQARGGMSPVATTAPAATATAASSSSASAAPAAAAATSRTVSSAASAAAPSAAPAARSAIPPRPPRPPLRRYGGGVRGTIRSIVAEEGVAGLYRGLLPSLLLVSHGAIQFAVYEELKSLARANNLWMMADGAGGSGGSGSNGSNDTMQLASLAVAAAGAASKVAACVATYPAQVLRARLQQKQLPASVVGAAASAAKSAGAGAAAVLHPPPVSASASGAAAVRYDRLFSALKTIIAREGVGGLYKGLSPTLLRVVPQSALTLMAYERVLGMLQAAVEAAAAAKHQQK